MSSAQVAIAPDRNVRDLTEAYDWASSKLGDRQAWSRSLEAILDMMLSSPFAMCLCWGTELNLLYNDAYAPFLGERHPAALGKPMREAWPDVWSDIEPLIRETQAGRSVSFEDLQLTMTRNGAPEETWWTFAYSPLRDDTGTIAGFLNVATETTKKVLNERDLRRERSRLEDSEADLRVLNQSLRGQHAQLAKAIDVARLGTFIWYIDTGTVELNDRSRELFGFAAGVPITAEDVFGRIAPEALAEVSRRSQEAIANAAEVEIDYPVVLPGGERR